MLLVLISLLSIHFAAAAQGGDFDGNVDIHFKHIASGEDLIQIIDHTRMVICYGKMSTGGAATISCQKFAESSTSAPSQSKKK